MAELLRGVNDMGILSDSPNCVKSSSCFFPTIHDHHILIHTGMIRVIDRHRLQPERLAHSQQGRSIAGQKARRETSGGCGGCDAVND